MSLRHIGAWLLRRWPLVGGALILAAFALGGVFSNPGIGGSQEQTDTEIVDPHIVATPLTPYPTIDLTQNPIRVEKIREPVIISTVAPHNPRTGRSTRPATGNYLYLPRIGRYYSLPNDVKLIETVDGLISCMPGVGCPEVPLYVYQRGEAFISIDSLGRTYDGMAGGDASAFPFFTVSRE